MSRLTALAKTFGRISQQLILAITIIGLATPLQALAATGRISEVMPDPAVIDDVDGEWIEIQNLTNSPLDITGWSIIKEGAGSEALTHGPIDASGTYIVCRGDVDPPGVLCDQYGSTGIGLNNNGGTFYLHDGTEVIDTFTYSADDVDSGNSIEKEADGNLTQNSSDEYDATNGNNGTPGIAEDIAVDQPQHVSPADNFTQSSSQINFDWTDVTDPANPVTYNFEMSTSTDENADGSFVSTNAFASGLSTSEKSVTYSGDNTLYWHVQSEDSLGNTSEWTDPWEVTIEDVEPPVTDEPLYSPVDNSNWIDTDIYISGRTADDNTGIESILVYARLAGTDDGYVLVKTVAFNDAKNSPECTSSECDWSFYWDPSAEPSPDGFPGLNGQAIFDIKVAGIDVAGNEESSAFAYDILWDTEAPDLPEHISPADGKHINYMNPTLKWEDVSDSDVSPPVCYVVQISYSNDTNESDNGFTNPEFSTLCIGDTEVEFPVPDGVSRFYWQVMACDSAYSSQETEELEIAYNDSYKYEYEDHCTDWTDPWSVNIDMTAPKVTVDSTSSSNHVRSLSGTIDDADASIKIEVLGKTYTATNNGDGTWSLPPIQFTPCHIHGTYEVKATATDEAGNVGKDSTTDELTIVDIPGCDGTSEIDYVSGAEESGEDVDSDGDGFTDAEEIEAGTNPNDPDDFPGSDKEEKDEGVEGETDESTFEYRWLILIAAVIAFLWFLLRRREEDEEGVVQTILQHS